MKSNSLLSMAVIGALAVGTVTTLSGHALAQSSAQSATPAVSTPTPAEQTDTETVDQQVNETNGADEVSSTAPGAPSDTDAIDQQVSETGGDTEVGQAESSESAAEPAETSVSETDETAALAGQAKLTVEQAQAAALAAYPGATVVKTDLGDENGTITYNVEMSDGAEVKIDANSGAMLGIDAAGE